MLGNGRVEAQCFDGEKRLAHIRGKMRKKVCLLCSEQTMRMLNPRRSGLTRATSFLSPSATSRMTKRTSSSSTPPTRLVVVRVLQVSLEAVADIMSQ
jgi:hypothetical protein